MYDVAIIGAGVTGSAIARELSRYQLNVCVIEREEDVCCGTSKANSAIIHAGFDAVPGTLKAKVNVKGNAMMDQIAKELDIPFKRNGSMVVCTKDQDPKGLEVLMERGKDNGVSDLQILDREALIAMEPNLSDDVVCALFAPTGGIVCPFHMTMGYAENACSNGVEFFLNTQVDDIKKAESGYELTVTHTDSGEKEIKTAKVVINAAGVYADTLNNMVSEHKLHITARKGEYMLLDKEKLLKQLKKLAFTFLPERHARRVLRVLARTNQTFGGFIGGKILDSLIIGVLCFIICAVLRIPYALLISVVVGCTNVIPVFGPFLGAIPCAFILLIVNPFSALEFLIMILILQQFDGNVLGPKILGESTGLSALWVLFAIIVGGKMLGFVGMLSGVPTFAVVYSLVAEDTDSRLGRKGIDAQGNPVPRTEPVQEDDSDMKLAP